MELTKPASPKRTVIKCKAKIRLLADPEVGLMVMPFEDALFLEIVKNFFRVDRAIELYQPSESQQAARQIEEEFAVRIVNTYKQIKLRQQDAIVQQLNALFLS
jgi:hypothetical protein